MKDLVMNLVLMNAKAISAFVVAVVASVAAKAFGADVPAEVEVALAALVLSVVVWLVPNKK